MNHGYSNSYMFWHEVSEPKSDVHVLQVAHEHVNETFRQSTLPLISNHITIQTLVQR